MSQSPQKKAFSVAPRSCPACGDRALGGERPEKHQCPGRMPAARGTGAARRETGGAGAAQARALRPRRRRKANDREAASRAAVRRAGRDRRDGIVRPGCLARLAGPERFGGSGRMRFSRHFDTRLGGVRPGYWFRPKRVRFRCGAGDTAGLDGDPGLWRHCGPDRAPRPRSATGCGWCCSCRWLLPFCGSSRSRPTAAGASAGAERTLGQRARRAARRGAGRP